MTKDLQKLDCNTEPLYQKSLLIEASAILISTFWLVLIQIQNKIKASGTITFQLYQKYVW